MLRFFVPGSPIAKARHHTVALKRCSCGKTTTANQCPGCGSTAMAFLANVKLADKKTESYEGLVALFARQAGATGTGTFPVSLEIAFKFPVPASRKKKLKEGDPHTQRPDLDNCIKSILDGCNGIAWHDDSCVVRLSASKAWTHGEPGVWVQVEEVKAVTNGTGNEPEVLDQVRQMREAEAFWKDVER